MKDVLLINGEISLSLDGLYSSLRTSEGTSAAFTTIKPMADPGDHVKDTISSVCSTVSNPNFN
jgi:hypothetical protein